MTRARGVAALVTWLCLLAVALAWLHRQGEALGPPGFREVPGWLEAGGPEVAVVAFLHSACIVVGWYLVVTTAAAAVLGCLRVPGGVAWVDACTPRPVRRLVGAVAGLAMSATATASVATGAAAHGFDGAPAGSVTTMPPVVASTDKVTMRRILEPTPEGVPVEMRPLPADSDDAVVPAPHRPGHRTIAVGDHFWSIAEEELARSRARPVTDAEVDPYWRLLVEENRREVADPDLLFPGQVVRILPVPPET